MKYLGSDLGEWVRRPLEDLAEDIIPFWEGVAKHEFRLCRCTRCGAWYFPYTLCVNHDDVPGFEESEWVPASGKGSVFTHVVVEKVADHRYSADVPFVLAMVELDEGPMFPARVVTGDPYNVGIGSRVQVSYVPVPDEEDRAWPVFVIDPEGAQSGD
jgi:uncharacterized protein